MPKEIAIVTKAPKVNRQLDCVINTGETAAECIDLFGDDVVVGVFHSEERVKHQAYIRGLLEATDESGKQKYSDTDILEKSTTWKLGVTTRNKKSKGDKANDILSSMSPDEKKALLADYAK